MLFGLILIVANRAHYILHVLLSRLSVFLFTWIRMALIERVFVQFEIWNFYTKKKSVDILQTWLKSGQKISGTSHKAWSVFYCCRWHKVAIKSFFVQHSTFLHFWQWHIAKQYIQDMLLHFLCNGYVNAPRCYLIRTFCFLCYSFGQNAVLRSRVQKFPAWPTF